MKLCPIYHLCRVVSQGRAKERVWVNNWYIGDGCLNNFLFHFMKKIVKEKKKKKIVAMNRPLGYRSIRSTRLLESINRNDRAIKFGPTRSSQLALEPTSETRSKFVNWFDICWNESLWIVSGSKRDTLIKERRRRRRRDVSSFVKTRNDFESLMFSWQKSLNGDLNIFRDLQFFS